ncbi:MULTISPECIES: TlpA family protein disulfide reductase [Nocardia]|uniref:TlpA family protein disulfide reductase n=1 Tax=Nocardia TaxID=1817 RepID=UPI0002EADABB|nr:MULTISPECIES: TlpA disulfide reductase family protein [Nocardia]
MNTEVRTDPRHPSLPSTAARRYLAVAIVLVATLLAWWASTTPEPSALADNDTMVISPSPDPNAGGALAQCPGQAAPSGARTALHGIRARCLGGSDAVDLGAALADGPVLINLWASWCGPCRTEIPVLDAYARHPDAITVVGFNIEDRPDTALALWRGLGVTYPSFVDLADARAALAAPPVLPLTYLLRADGTLRRITTPAVFDHLDQIHTAVQENL